MPLSPEAHSALRRFQAVNRQRLVNLVNSLPPKQQLLIDALPLLFHLNHHRLPGFVDHEEMPTGINDYAPDEPTLRAAKALAPLFDYKPAPIRHPALEALFLIDHGKEADGRRRLEMWLCLRPGLSDAHATLLGRKVELLRRRAGEIELALETRQLEAEAFRDGRVMGVGWLGRERSRDHLLTEAFYLSSIHLAGRYPLWWLVPPEEEPRYDACAAKLLADDTIASETIDFGGLEGLSAEAFFRAVLWRFYAELATPCLSLPELLLMEVYTGEFPAPRRLSGRFKRAVYSGNLEYAQLDTLAMMAGRLRDHLVATGETARLEVLKHCLQQRLAPERIKGSEQTLTAVRDEARRVAASVSRAYQAITEAAQREAEAARIDPMELIILGRRLYAAFDPRGGRVEWINPGLAGELIQGALSFHYTAKGKQPWKLHQGLVRPDADAVPLMEGASALELLAWAYFNGLVDDSTTLALHPGEARLGPRDMQGALAALERLFPGGRPPTPEPGELSNPALPSIHGLFVNFGTVSASLMSRGDQQVISDQTDPFRFGAMQENLVSTLDLVTVTTWGEVFVHRFEGRSALLNGVKHFIEAVSHPALPAPPTVAAFCFSAAQGTLISRRMEELFNALSEQASGKRPAKLPGYILGLGRGHALIHQEGNRPVSRYAEGVPELMKRLGLPRDRHTRWRVDPAALRGTPLPTVLHGVKPGVVQLYRQPSKGKELLYILDERGSLFQAAAPVGGGRYRRFLQDALRRLFLWRPLAHGELEDDQLQWSGNDDRPFTGELECYRLVPTAGGFSARADEEEESDGEGLQLVVQAQEEGFGYTLYCGEQMIEGSTLDTLIDALLPHIETGRQPLLESVDAPPALLGAESADALQSLHFLRFKRLFDRKLEEALKGG